ncbi:oxidoreductase [Vallicoccus soli]|uniref:Oxidoreductase n=1 Tax=Vallicoccus soli TaxID=2339232 RepID=A0A3A3ZL90_9ACTN|nr:oxidoreductase [Vallicoccus soli]RJK96926.1 oxidoreductase [Vallicoccus soli]
MGLFDRVRRGRRQAPGTTRSAGSGDRAHLVEWARARTGVEAFVEPPTTVTATTVVLVASTGEWTRRRCPDARAAHDLAHELGIPSYDAAVVGYPRRMREWNARVAAEQRRAREG